MKGRKFVLFSNMEISESIMGQNDGFLYKLGNSVVNTNSGLTSLCFLCSSRIKHKNTLPSCHLESVEHLRIRPNTQSTLRLSSQESNTWVQNAILE